MFIIILFGISLRHTSTFWREKDMVVRLFARLFFCSSYHQTFLSATVSEQLNRFLLTWCNLSSLLAVIYSSEKNLKLTLTWNIRTQKYTFVLALLWSKNKTFRESSPSKALLHNLFRFLVCIFLWGVSSV